MSTKTNSIPDLTSMLLKPIQRVLKYPLFLSELKKNTDPLDPEYSVIDKTLSEMIKTTTHINEIKRRKELIDRIILGDGSGSTSGSSGGIGVKMKHGLNKRFVRSKQSFRNSYGLNFVESWNDPNYDLIESKFLDLEQNLFTLKGILSNIINVF